MFRKLMHAVGTVSLLVVGSLFLTTSPAYAADQIVTNCSNDTDLRNKLNALQSSGGGTLTFNCGVATIVLSSVLPAITADVSVDGGSKITLSGSNSSRHFVVNNGGRLSLGNITLTKGYSGSDGGSIYVNGGGTLWIAYSKFLDNHTASTASGGAIVTYGSLNIVGSEFAFNSGGNGGAIYPRFGGAVTAITGSNFHDNSTTNTTNGWGGAMMLWDGAPVTLTDSVFTKNTARFAGGAIFTQGASSLIANGSTFTQNNTTDTFGEGGAIHVQGPLSVGTSTFTQNNSSRGGALFIASGTSTVGTTLFSKNWAAYGGAIRQTNGTLTLYSSTLDGNGYGPTGSPVTTGGGAISWANGSATLTNATLSNNWASYGGAADHANGTVIMTNVTLSGNSAVGGAALDQDAGSTTLTNVTVNNNSAGFFGALAARGGTMTLRNTIVANTQGIANCNGSIVSSGFNLSNDNSCASAFNQAGDKNGSQYDPLLGPLKTNGGFAKTHLPQATSPALDNATASGAPTTDQRGTARPQGAALDIGAVERCQTSPPKPVLVSPGNNSNFKGRKVLLDWTDTPCAQSYTVILKLGSKTGTLVQKKTKLSASTFTTQTLVKGQTYAWQVTAIGDTGKAKSAWQSFTVK